MVGEHRLWNVICRSGGTDWKSVGARKGLGCKSSSFRMADDVLLHALRDYRAGDLSGDQMLVVLSRYGVIPVYNYTACTKCDEQTRCHRAHGQVVLCSECGGDGWTNQRIEGWIDPCSMKS